MTKKEKLKAEYQQLLNLPESSLTTTQIRRIHSLYCELQQFKLIP
jgi:hypothetical protein